MTNLEQLVPPPELCQQIPKDAFNDTALVWWFSGMNYWALKRSDPVFIRWPSWILAPAPTAQEILEKFPDYSLQRDGTDVDNKFFSKCANGIGGVTRKKLPEMLLRAWLIKEGIDIEEKP